jgi:hypothetical protein
VIHRRATQLGTREAKAMNYWHDTINSFWGARRETPEALAIRLNRLIDQLALINPALHNWFWIDADKKVVPFVGVRSRLADEIAARVTRGDDGEPEPVYGYWMSVLNSLEDTPRFLSLSINAGADAKPVVLPNMATMHTAWNMEPDPTITTYRNFRGVLLACAECFDATFGSAYPTGFSDHWPKKGHYRFGWINYVCPRFAPLITPPKTAIVEYRPGGGLLMAATDETFVTSNPQHMAVARDIEAALAPLNALPWPPDGEADPAAG